MGVETLIDEKAILCLMGATASGKTDIAMRLVQAIPCEIISVDSAMVYRGMDIGTAKPTPAELALAPHHLIDLCDPAESYSVGRFCEDARQAIEHIHAAGKLPLLTGGSMLYFHQLQQGFSDMPVTDATVRRQIAAQAVQHGWPSLHADLMLHDPTTATKLHSNDAQRISRALEVFYSSGKTLSEWQNQQSLQPITNKTLNLILAPSDRTLLHQRIAQRFDEMLQQGFEQEVQGLFQRGDLNVSLPSMRSVGYRQVWGYLAGEYQHEQMREKAIVATRQLAKRQFTWLRRWQQAHWFDTLARNTYNKVLNTINHHE